MAAYKILGFEVNLDAVPSTKKEFVKKFSYIKNVGDFWQEVKKAKQSLK